MSRNDSRAVSAALALLVFMLLMGLVACAAAPWPHFTDPQRGEFCNPCST